MRQTLWRNASEKGNYRKCIRRCLCSGCVMMAAVMFLTGCTVRIDRTNKTDVPEFTVLDKDMIPEEMVRLIEEQKEKPFRLTYADKGILYIAEGYGRQPTTGYSVEVSGIYETSNAVCFESRLIGPENGEEKKEAETFPYVAVMLEDSGKDVIFD